MLQILDKQTELLVAVFDNTLEGKWYREDTHKDSTNNFETFDFTANGRIPEAKFLTGKNHVLIKGDGDSENDWREFVIFFTHHENGEVEVKCNASYVEMSTDRMISRFLNVSQTTEQAMAFGLQGTDWQMGTIEWNGIRTLESKDILNPYGYLLLVAREFDMQLRFRVVVEFHRIVGRYVDLVHNVGQDRGKEVVLGKDLVNVIREEDSDQIVTALIVEGPEKEDGSRITVEVKNEEARQRWGKNGRHIWGYHRIESDNLEMASSEVSTHGLRELNKRLSSVVTYVANAVSIQHVFGFKHERVMKGDTVRVKDTSYNPPLYLQATVIEILRHPSRPAIKEYTLGEIIEFSEEEVLALFYQLRNQLNKKLGLDEVEQIVLDNQQIVYSAIPPESPTMNLLWMDTSRSPNVLYRWNGDGWVKGSPTQASDIGAETPQGAQDKVDALKLTVDLELGQLETALSDFETEVHGSFADGIIETAEAVAIEKYKNSINAEKLDVDNRYNAVYANAFLTGTPKTNLSSAKSAVNTAHTDLINAITSAISDSKATATERSDVDAKFTAYRSAFGTISTRFEEALDSISQAMADAVSKTNAYIVRLQMESNTVDETLRELNVEIVEFNNNTYLANNPVLTELNTRKDIMTTKANELRTLIANAIADNIVSQFEDTEIDAKRTEYRQAVDQVIQQIRITDDELLRVKTNEVIEFGERKIHKGSSFPIDPQELDLWVDTFEAPPIWRQYLNGGWVNLTRTSFTDMTGRIQETQISNDFIKSPMMAADAVLAKHIAANQIDSTMITTAGLDAGVITFGTMTGITADVGQAGMTAVGTTSTTVRFWAGAVFNSRNTAPFRVLQNGRVYASDLWIEGGSINVATDIRLGNNLYLGTDQANRFDPRTIKFNDGAYLRGGGGSFGAALELGAEYIEDLTADWYFGYGYKIKNGFFYSSVDFAIDSDVNTIFSGPVTASGPEWKRTLSEKGFCGLGGVSAGVSGAFAYTAVNFRFKKTYVPSSISLQAETDGTGGNTTMVTNAINVDGFAIYIASSNTSAKNSYWRGWYTA